MSNSPFINHTRISPNRTSGRNHTIDTITIHCVVGQCSVETLGEWFARSSTQASSNYGVGPDGRIGMYVEEKDRSWCSSSRSNDNRAVTIEVASDTSSPYAVKDKAYYSLVRLVADICKRNGIKKLLWRDDKSLIGQVDKQNMTLHMWFANKDCPGAYLHKYHYDIASRVNAILAGGHPVLFLGMRGSDVKELQEDLIKLGVADFTTADGIFGSKTDAALRRFQTAGLGSADGMAGKKTWAAIEKALAELDKPAENEDPADKYSVKVPTLRAIYKDVPAKIGECGAGTYSIVEEKEGYGRLASGAGWISLEGTEKV